MDSRGLTVVEILVALIILGVLAAIAVPNVAALRSRWQLSAAARQIVMDLKVARTRAIADIANHRVRFAVHGSSYQPQRQGTDGSYANEGTSVALADGIVIDSCTATAAAVGFRPQGNASTFGTVTLRNDAGAQRRIVVDIVGRMRVE